jgi:hypothetical protein
MKKHVNVLGTAYDIKKVKISECELLKEKHWCGSCNELTHTILIGDASEEEFFGKLSEEEQELITKQILRHEITHAFLNESGLQASSAEWGAGWAHNEEMIDWIALQFPKMLKAFEEAGCL